MTGIYLTPAEAADALGISRTTITRCKQKGAPVHYFGPCGRMYRIRLDELIEWMDAQGRQDPAERQRAASVIEMKAARHQRMEAYKKAR